MRLRRRHQPLPSRRKMLKVWGSLADGVLHTAADGRTWRFKHWPDGRWSWVECTVYMLDAEDNIEVE